MFMEQSKARGIRKVIIDVSSNSGGRASLGYEAFKQFFPAVEPFGGQRIRAHEAYNILGTEISSHSSSALDRNGFSYKGLLDQNLDAFGSWLELYGPERHNDDNFTHVLRYNLSGDHYDSAITITGYRERNNHTQYFGAKDIILLSDGMCGSTCFLFMDFMMQMGVRTFALGGRPQFGPMQPVGGTKGSQVLNASSLWSRASSLLENKSVSSVQLKTWAEVLPAAFGVLPVRAEINFKDSIRATGSDIPAQFTNETSHCRLFYNGLMLRNVTNLWGIVADIVWGNTEGLDTSSCVPGSTNPVNSALRYTDPPPGPTSSTSSSSSSIALPTATVDYSRLTRFAPLVTGFILGLSL
ncbi:hypothetical protein LTR56_021766 [Elasticomyces elasticus]|nr:hypothetical protein LTR56_021766 [Elasticomyces elasticus]